METVADALTAWHSQAQRLLNIGYEIAGASAPAIQNNDDGQGDIRLIAVLLIARSLSNMRGTLTMIREKQVVEARTLARCIQENFFWIAGYASDPEKFRQIMIDDDRNRKGLQGQALFESGELPDEAEKKLRQWMRENKDWRTAKSTTPKQLARDADIRDAYTFYNLLSTDAHPTLHALYRHVVSIAGQPISDIDLDPAPAEHELAETLALGCFGLVQVLVCACTILGSDAVERVDLLAHEYLEMMKAHVDVTVQAEDDPVK